MQQHHGCVGLPVWGGVLVMCARDKGHASNVEPRWQLLMWMAGQVGAGSEDIQVATNIVSLRCPLTGSRVQRAGRFAGIDALAGFDLDAFLSMAARTRKWQCPVTMRHACVQQLQNDAFLQGMLNRLKVCFPSWAPHPWWWAPTPGPMAGCGCDICAAYTLGSLDFHFGHVQPPSWP